LELHTEFNMANKNGSQVPVTPKSERLKELLIAIIKKTLGVKK